MTNELWLGLATGVIFGFLLQKGRVLRFEKQVGAMLLKDMTIVKFLLSAALVGMVGIHLLADLGVIALKHKAMNLGGILLGGSLFGVGWAVMGYCPGTSVGALGEGRWHAVWAILGMMTGAALFAEAYPFLESTVLRWADWGKISLADMAGISHWIVIAALAVIFALFFALFEKKNL
jgi:hypothetical protein